MEALKQEGLKAYRALLKAQRNVFHGDRRVLSEARIRTRREFEAARSLTSAEEIQMKIKEAHGIAKFLTENLVQARLNGSLFKVKLDERLEMWDYTRNGRPKCGCC